MALNVDMSETIKMVTIPPRRPLTPNLKVGVNESLSFYTVSAVGGICAFWKRSVFVS